MGHFFEYYFGVESRKGETAVSCPFPHYTSTGMSYFETHPSAHVNTEQGLFHCKVCGAGHSEIAFIKELMGCTFGDATKLSKVFNNQEDLAMWEVHTHMNEEAKALANSIGITNEVVAELNLASDVAGVLSFPVLMYDKLVDIRRYVPGASAQDKMRSRPGSPTGLLIPFDKLKAVPKNKTILLCAGEKDMANARSHGFEAYTLTGGEMTLPLSPMWFKDRNVVVLYDNDQAGKVGSIKLCNYLTDYTSTLKNCIGFHAVCVEDKEDLTDFFTKYEGTREQLIQFMNETPMYVKQDVGSKTQLPLVTLQDATTPELINKMVRSNIQVVAVSEAQFVTPTTIVAEKLKESGEHDTMFVGQVKEWELLENNIQDILHLTDNNFKEDDINKNIKDLLKISLKEKYIRLTKPNKAVVYKAVVTDMFESMNTDSMPMEYTAYSVGTRLESGKKYMATYKLTPHPYRGQQLVMIITNVIEANDSVSNFTIDSKAKENLDVIRNLQGTVTERMSELTNRVKGMLGYDGDDTLIQVLDLSYHTVLAFNFGRFKDVRGYLDTLVVGESRVGKSSTAEALRNMYQLGTFTSLAGNSATIPGLVGGSNKTSNGAMQTKAGLIPQNHKGLIIFEEFGKCNNSIVSELTDIRSSNEVRITRVSGTLTLPAMVRMISLSNVKAAQGEIKSIASYPNGIAIVTELVSTAEDIARYDILAVLGYKGNKAFDPFWAPMEPLDPEVYKTRVRWVWSRSADKVVISEAVSMFIIEQANALNVEFDCHIKIFGTEAWKKISRLAIAVAGYLVSTDATYQNIVVEKEHVEFAVALYRTLYDNRVFRLKEYVANERKYNTIDENGIKLLNDLYMKAPGMVLLLEQEAKPTRTTLVAASGMDNNQYNMVMGSMIRGSFVRIIGNDVLATERFRIGMTKIDRNRSLVRLGENNT